MEGEYKMNKEKNKFLELALNEIDLESAIWGIYSSFLKNTSLAKTLCDELESFEVEYSALNNGSHGSYQSSLAFKYFDKFKICIIIIKCALDNLVLATRLKRINDECKNDIKKLEDILIFLKEDVKIIHSKDDFIENFKYFRNIRNYLVHIGSLTATYNHDIHKFTIPKYKWLSGELTIPIGGEISSTEIVQNYSNALLNLKKAIDQDYFVVRSIKISQNWKL